MTAACAAGDDCPTGQPPGPRALLCDGCLDTSRRAVEALPRDWVNLEQLLAPALGVWGDGTRTMRAEAPIPLNLYAEELQAAIWRTLTTWEEIVREAARLSQPAARRPAWVARWITNTAGVTVRGRINYRIEHPTARGRPMRPGPMDVRRAAIVLAPRLDLLSTLPPTELVAYPCAAPEEQHRHGALRYTVLPGWRGVLDLAYLHRRAVGMLGLTEPVRRLPGECSECGRAGLRQRQPRWRGDEQPVTCDGCGQTWTYEQYQRYVGLWEAATR